jgi:hypothetical protein
VSPFPRRTRKWSCKSLKAKLVPQKRLAIEPTNRPEHRRAAKAAQLGVALQAYTIPQYCGAFNISKSSLYRAWARGAGPPYYYDGRCRRIPVTGAIEYQRRLLSPPSPMP